MEKQKYLKAEIAVFFFDDIDRSNMRILLSINWR